MAGQEMDLEAIVREVLRRLEQLRAEPTRVDGARAGTPGPTVPDKAAQSPDPRQLQLSERTITLGTLAGRLAGVAEVLVPAGAVVTPSVRDELRKRRIALRVASAPAADVATPSGVVLGVAGPAQATASVLAAVHAEASPVERIERECVLEVVRQVSQAVASQGRIGLVLTDRPAVALCLANRQAEIRAAWGVNLAAVREAARLIGANVLVVNPAQHGVYELRGMIREFVGGRHDCPKVYRRTLGGES